MDQVVVNMLKNITKRGKSNNGHMISAHDCSSCDI